jgi:hypothetical protein
MTVYHPNRIEKYISDAGMTGAYSDAGWRPYHGDGDTEDAIIEDDYGNQYTAAVVWWTDTGTPEGEPLGLPVFHLRNASKGGAYGRSDIADVVPSIQDMVNLSTVSLLAATQLSGFKIGVLFGIDPQNDKLKLGPGGWIYSSNPDGSAQQMGETNLVQLMDIKNGFIKDAATTTGTPLSFFNITGQIAAEGTQKQLEAALLAKVQAAQKVFGNAYARAVKMALKLDSLFTPNGGGNGLSLEAIDALNIEVRWKPADVRNEREQHDMAKIAKELGVPLEVVLSKYLEFDQDEIAEIMSANETKRAVTIGTLAAEIQQREAEAENEPAPVAPVPEAVPSG